MQNSESSPIVIRQAIRGLLETIRRETMKKLLIVITAFVLLGLFANAAMAAKSPKLITLIGGPLSEVSTIPWRCDIHNHSTESIDVVIEICAHERDNVLPAVCLPDAVTVLSERFYGLTINSGVNTSGICRVSYFGKRGDILGTLCASNGCVQLQ
jgi:hypothetical protein